MLNRRLFLKKAGAAAVASATLTGVPSIFNAHAADSSDYKALVCVFFLGGLDNHDVILPYDPSSYEAFRTVRQTLLNQQGTQRNRESLLPLVPADTSILAGRQVALPPEMPQLKAMFDQGQAAVIGNVGPLIEPVTRQSFLSGAARLPPRLFSHNDQQNTWQASAPEGAQFGWGGLFADAILGSGANVRSPEFTTIASTDVGPFLSGRVARPYQVSVSGAASVDLLEELNDASLPPEERQLLEAVRRQLQASNFDGSHTLEKDIAGAFRGSFLSNAAYNQARQSGMSLQTTFPGDPLGGQLSAVAETIAVRDQLSVSRQVFFVGIGGFDTHSGQASSLPALLTQIDNGLAAFQQAMQELNMSNNVTLFTASDFGRTLAVNGDGTDHGWGGHSFVLGGSVKGRQIYGSIPPPTFGHEADAGGGRLIPSLSIEQLAAPLGRWFGLNDDELLIALPNLRNFGAWPDFLN